MYAKKNSGKKVVLTLLAIVLLISGAVGGTVAWLVSNTNTVTNTFTVGKITIDLEETINGNRTSAKEAAVENEGFKIVPGASEAKDPVVTVEAGSEKCYVYVCVDNQLVIGGVTVGILDIDPQQWQNVCTNGTKTVYRYAEEVDAATADQELPVFTTVTYADTITAETISSLNGKNIVISAYAHQSENVTEGHTVTDSEAKAHFGISD